MAASGVASGRVAAARAVAASAVAKWAEFLEMADSVALVGTTEVGGSADFAEEDGAAGVVEKVVVRAAAWEPVAEAWAVEMEVVMGPVPVLPLYL